MCFAEIMLKYFMSSPFGAVTLKTSARRILGKMSNSLTDGLLQAAVERTLGGRQDFQNRFVRQRAFAVRVSRRCRWLAGIASAAFCGARYHRNDDE